MNIALIGLGRMEIPQDNMGSIESILWNYKIYLEMLGHSVTIYNSPWIHEVIYSLNTHDYDFIHVHSDIHIAAFTKHLRKPFCVTSHCGGFAKFTPGDYSFYPAFNYLFEDSLHAPGNIVISPQIEQLYQKSGYAGFLRVLRNPVAVDKFQMQPHGNGRVLYLGKIQPRKRQALVSALLDGVLPVDFVGQWNKKDEPILTTHRTCRYLGSWTRKQIYQNISKYSVLCMLSNSETAAPLVVLEALAAGVSVVVNTSSSNNLDSRPFITILPDDMLEKEIIARELQRSIEANSHLRNDIHRYAKQRFDYHMIIPEYLQIIDAFRSYKPMT